MEKNTKTECKQQQMNTAVFEMSNETTLQERKKTKVPIELNNITVYSQPREKITLQSDPELLL